jgi:hypothetical protein
VRYQCSVIESTRMFDNPTITQTYASTGIEGNPLGGSSPRLTGEYHAGITTEELSGVGDLGYGSTVDVFKVFRPTYYLINVFLFRGLTQTFDSTYIAALNDPWEVTVIPFAGEVEMLRPIRYDVPTSNTSHNHTLSSGTTNTYTIPFTVAGGSVPIRHYAWSILKCSAGAKFQFKNEIWPVTTGGTITLNAQVQFYRLNDQIDFVDAVRASV